MITDKDIKELAHEVRALTNFYPDGQYDPNQELANCSYFRGMVVNGPDQPGCIVGQAMATLPAFEEVLALAKEQEEHSIATDGVGFGALMRSLVGYAPGTEDGARYFKWVIDVQNEQDSRATWGEAREQADRMEGWRP